MIQAHGSNQNDGAAMPVEDHPDASSHFVERRSKVRFPLGLRVSYRTLGQGSPRSGEGLVLNMSRSAVVVSAEQDLNMSKRNGRPFCMGG